MESPVVSAFQVKYEFLQWNTLECGWYRWIIVLDFGPNWLARFPKIKESYMVGEGLRL